MMVQGDGGTHAHHVCIVGIGKGCGWVGWWSASLCTCATPGNCLLLEAKPTYCTWVVMAVVMVVVVVVVEV